MLYICVVIEYFTRNGTVPNRYHVRLREYETEVRTVARAFLKLGLERYNSVGILGFNSPQWFIADIAAIYAGYDKLHFIIYRCPTLFGQSDANFLSFISSYHFKMEFLKFN